jgi:hypothetical protein
MVAINLNLCVSVFCLLQYVPFIIPAIPQLLVYGIVALLEVEPSKIDANVLLFRNSAGLSPQ